MRRPLLSILLVSLMPRWPPLARAGGADFRVVFRYRAGGPASVKDYESEVHVYERLPGGGEKQESL